MVGGRKQQWIGTVGGNRRVFFAIAMLWYVSVSVYIPACYAFQVFRGGSVAGITITSTSTSTAREGQHQNSAAAARSRSRSLMMSLTGGEDDPAILAIRSLASFHEGQWTGRARSFAVTPDVAAGVVKRKLSPEYNVAVRLSTSSVVTIDTSSSSSEQPDLGTISLSETVSWGDKISHRSMPLFSSPGASSSSSSQKQKSGVSSATSAGDVDVDDVDASYSLDATNPTDFPSILTGLSGKNNNLQFVVEHCIAAGEDRRCRCFAIYGRDDSLLRVVIADEKRVTTDDKTSGKKKSRGNNNDAFSMQDLIEMQNDVDRLVDKISANIQQEPGTFSDDSPSLQGDDIDIDIDIDDEDDDDDENDELKEASRLAQLGNAMADPKVENARKLSSYDMSLLEMTNGIWLGDTMIREPTSVAASPNEGGAGKGFENSPSSSSSASSSSSEPPSSTFGGWNPGVQKIAYRWMWNFEQEIRQVVDAGKSLGTSMDFYLKKSLAGNICLDESFSRRKPKDERMVYIDWGEDSVGFLLGPYSVQVPRYVNFDPSATTSRAPAVTKPFYTEFGIFQSVAPYTIAPSSDGVIDVTDNNSGLEELCWSKIGRLYNFEGRLKQGCTSFSTFKRFEIEDDDDDIDDDIDADLANLLK